MKKIISLFLGLNILSLNFAFAQTFKDNLSEQLDKNLKVEKVKLQPIEDELVNLLNPDLKVEKNKLPYFEDELITKTLDKNLKIQKQETAPIFDSLASQIDKTKIDKEVKKVQNFFETSGYIKVSPKNYYTTKEKLAEGGYIDFILAQDAKIGDKLYKKGALIKARVETLSQNGAYGVPADLVIGNFTMPDNMVLNGQIEKQGANRALWVYPLGYTLTCFFFIGLPIFAIRGGHAKLEPQKVYEIEI